MRAHTNIKMRMWHLVTETERPERSGSGSVGAAVLAAVW